MDGLQSTEVMLFLKSLARIVYIISASLNKPKAKTEISAIASIQSVDVNRLRRESMLD